MTEPPRCLSPLNFILLLKLVVTLGLSFHHLSSDSLGNNSETEVLVQKMYLGMFSGIMPMKESWKEGGGETVKKMVEASADPTENSGVLMYRQRCPE